MDDDEASLRAELDAILAQTLPLADAVYAGDWDGEGLDTLVVRRGNTYYFSDTFEGGIASRERTFGRADDATVVGDWTGSGSDSIGVARTS